VSDSDQAMLYPEDFEVDHERLACELSLQVDTLESLLEKLKIENRVMRDYIERGARDCDDKLAKAVIDHDRAERAKELE